ncbi:ATP-binding protein [Xenorhabdus bovienii]|uniref:ATP-binding protein n=1 Tax=Xenorhabdus bovienii TaxID=40576 RepID=UPI003DA6748C
MSQLLRLILIHTHLPGVYEIELDQHSNICGTNASGKTTLQRLLPVFYGEQPNRVVPKTRKKFDEFYLPSSNSYIIYEYQRSNGNICQVVLTRKNEGGVEYRFVTGAYNSEHYLRHTEEGVKALSYSDFVATMRELGNIQITARISATSEYRSIIQNDMIALRGNSADNHKLRRLAAAFSLVEGNHKLRHIEKLVSAVHAKEGKMDTLKAMLAAIFEEDGVTLPETKVNSSKTREWIQRMRHSLHFDKLQQDFERLQQLGLQVDDNEAQLAALRPLLQLDEQQQKENRAQKEQILFQCRRALQQLEDEYNQQLDELNGKRSATHSDLQATRVFLNNIQKEYEEFERRDMKQLQIDTAALPQWRISLQELAEEQQLMKEEQGELSAKFAQHKNKLNDNYQSFNNKINLKIRQLNKNKDVIYQQYDVKAKTLSQLFNGQQHQQEKQYAIQLTEIGQSIAIIKTELGHSQLTAEELEAAEIAELRVEQSHLKVQQLSQQIQEHQQYYQQALQQQEAGDRQLEHCRSRLHQAERELQQLHRQLDPEQGTLRHFLRLNYPGWQQNLGKALSEDLLDRKDLQPYLDTSGDLFFGLQLELANVEMPAFALDEAAILHRITSAEQAHVQAKTDLQTAEKNFNEYHKKVQQHKAQLEQLAREDRQLQHEIEHTRSSRQRLKEKHAALDQERKQLKRNELQFQEKNHQSVQQQQQQMLTALKEEQNTQELQLSFELQTEIQNLELEVEALDRQLRDKRNSINLRIEELEQTLNAELSTKGIDHAHFRLVEQQYQQLKGEIQQTEARADELIHWQRFIHDDWEGLRPQRQALEITLSQRERELKQQLDRLNINHHDQGQQLSSQRKLLQREITDLEQLLNQLKNKLSALQLISLDNITPASLDTTGDIYERLARADEMQEQYTRITALLEVKLHDFKSVLSQNAQTDFLDRLDHEINQLPSPSTSRQQIPILADLLKILKDQQQQLVEMGENIGGDLKKFFTVFSDINRRISLQSHRLSEAVADDLLLEEIGKSKVRIRSTIDELKFWQPLKLFARRYDEWRSSGKAIPSANYLNALSDVVELMRGDDRFSMESLLSLELHLNEGGSDLVIKNDRQLLEASSHGMAYMILCKYLLAFTRLLRGKAEVTIHWPIDEIGTLAYHNVEKLFTACDNNKIVIVGAFPNLESEVLMLFKHRYLIDADQFEPGKRRLKRIHPEPNRLSLRLAQKQQEAI